MTQTHPKSNDVNVWDELNMNINYSITNSTVPDELLSVRQAVLEALPTYAMAVGGKTTDHAKLLTVSQIQGGITNRLYRISISTTTTTTLNPVLVRVYGEGSDLFIDRSVDEAVFRELTLLPEGTFGVQLLATLNDGRIEEFFDGCRTLINRVQIC